MSSRRLMNRSLSSDGRSYCSGYSDISSQSRTAGCRSYLSSVRSESRSTLCSVMAQLTEEIQPTFESTLKSKAVSEDANVKFSCVVSGYPVPEVTWYKDDIQMDRYCGRPKYEISRDDKTHTLQIYNCTLDDAAIYQASAQNSRGIVSCSGVLEVGTMSEYKIHQNYFTKLKQRNENRRRELEHPRNTGTETVPAASEHVRMSSPERLQRKRGADNPTEERVVEVDALGQTLPSVQKPGPVHGNSEVITNREKDRQELTYIHDAVNNGTSEPINEYVKKKVKISTERSKENRLNGVRDEIVDDSTEHRNKMDTKPNEKLSVKADKSGSEETKATLSRKKADSSRQRSENQSLKSNKCASEESKRAQGALITSVTESRNKMEITETKTTDKQLLTMNKSGSRELKAAQGDQVAEVTETANKKDVNSKINKNLSKTELNKKTSEELKSAQMVQVTESRNKTDRKAAESEKVNKSASEDTKRDQGPRIAAVTETRNKMVNKIDPRNNEKQSVNLNKSTSEVSKKDRNAQTALVTESRNKMDLKVTNTNVQQQRLVIANKSAIEETTQGSLIPSVTVSRDKTDITDTKTSEQLSKKVNKSVSEQSKTTQMASVIQSKNKTDISGIKNVNKSALKTAQGDQIASVTEHKNIVDITDRRKSLVTVNTSVLEESKRAQNPQIDSVMESKAKMDEKDTLKSDKLQTAVSKGSNKAQCAQIDSMTESKAKVDVTDRQTNANKSVNGESKKAQGASKASVTASKAKMDVRDTKMSEIQSENMKENASEAKKLLKPIATRTNFENTKSTQSSDTKLQALGSLQNCNLTHTDNKHVDFNEHGNRNPVDTRVRILPHSCGGNDVNVDTGERNVSGSSLRASAAADTQTEPTEPPIHEDVPPPHKEEAKELKEQPTLMCEVNASSSVTETLYSCHPASQEQKLTAGDQFAASTKSSTLVTDTQQSDKISSGHVSHKLQGGQVTTATTSSLGDDTLTNTCKKESKAENQLIKESDKPKREIKPASMSQNNMDENEMKSIKTNVQKSMANSDHSTTQVIVTESVDLQQKTTNGSSIKECQSTSHVATDNVVKMDIQEQSNAATSEVKSTYEMQSYSGHSTFLSQHSKALATEFTIPAIYITDVDSTSQNVEISPEANGETSKCIIGSKSLCNNEKPDLSQSSQLSEVKLTQGPQKSSNRCSTESVASGFNRQKELSMQCQNVDKSIREYDVTQTGNYEKTDPDSFIKHLRSAALDLEMSNQCSTGAPHVNSKDNNKYVEEVSSAAIQTEVCKVKNPLKTPNSQVFNSTAEPATSIDQKTTFSRIKTDKSETTMATNDNKDRYQGDKLSLKSQPASPIIQSVSDSPLTTALETQSPRLIRRTVPIDQPKPVENENIKPKSTEKNKENQFKVPQVIRKIRPEVFDASGHLKLWCQFFNIVSDSTIRWFKDEVEIAEIKRSAGDEAQVCLAIIRMSKRDCGIYRCTITNEYGKDSTEYHLSSEFLSNMFMHEELQEVGEEIEMTPLIFSKGFADAGCWGSKFYGRVTTEEAQVGLGCEHKTRRLKVIYGLDPVFESGSSCFMKVRSPIAYESREETVLAERNLQITKQDCRIQNMAREYFKIFAAETRAIESFGAALEVIPLYFTYWPASSVPYATVEAELKGVYLRYCGLDRTGSLVINEKSEVGQKCSSLQHWIYQWTSGNVLFSRIEGVDTILTNIGIAVRSKGYQGFPCEANPQVFEQFQIQHQCNYFCGLLKLKSIKAPETLQTPVRSKGSSSPLLQRKTAVSSSSPQTSRKATKSPKLSRKLNPQTSS